MLQHQWVSGPSIMLSRREYKLTSCSTQVLRLERDIVSYPFLHTHSDSQPSAIPLWNARNLDRVLT